MNCANHPETEASAFCRECGKPMCAECRQPALGSVYCQEHVPVTVPPPARPAPNPFADQPRASYYAPPPPPPPSAGWADSPYSAPAGTVTLTPDPNAHPVLALLLGFIPGVGAIYNGQYAKGLIHAVIFGLLVSLISSARSDGAGAFLGIMIAAWVFYQAFEAYHTARKRRFGLAVEEFSSLFEVRPATGKFPVGALLLIGVGFVLLLETTDIVRFDDLARFWPVGLIAAGGYMLYGRLHTPERPAAPMNGEARQ